MAHHACQLYFYHRAQGPMMLWLLLLVMPPPPPPPPLLPTRAQGSSKTDKHCHSCCSAHLRFRVTRLPKCYPLKSVQQLSHFPVENKASVMQRLLIRSYQAKVGRKKKTTEKGCKSRGMQLTFPEPLLMRKIASACPAGLPPSHLLF